MKNNQVVLTLLLTIFSVSFILGQQDDCANCPSCAKRLTDGQKTLNEAKNQLESEIRDYKMKLAKASDKTDLNNAKAENNRLTDENQSLSGQLADSRNTIQSLNDELAKLRGQVRTKADEATSYKSAAEKEKEEKAKKEEDVKRLETSQSSSSGILCIRPWLNDRIVRTVSTNNIFLNDEYFNFYDRNDPSSELCFISFEGNTGAIEQIKIGKLVITDPLAIECYLNRIENLFLHYQDVCYLRFSLKYKDRKSDPMKVRFFNVRNKFFRQLGRNEAKGKLFSISKWGKGDVEGVSISIATNEESSDDELVPSKR